VEFYSVCSRPNAQVTDHQEINIIFELQFIFRGSLQVANYCHACKLRATLSLSFVTDTPMTCSPESRESGKKVHYLILPLNLEVQHSNTQAKICHAGI
jgi:hypothetical protein